MTSLRDEFFEDFRDETSEILRAVGLVTAELERSARPDLYDSLLRHLHTLKGLASMVELSSAAALLHLLETAVLPFRGADQSAPKTLLEMLNRAILDLGQQISQPEREIDVSPYRSQLESLKPPIDPPARAGAEQVKADHFALLPDVLAEALSESDRARMVRAEESFLGLYVVEFSPDPDRPVEGRGINWVREKLEALGTLLRVVPKVEHNKVRFVFLLVASVTPSFSDLDVEVTVLVPCRERKVQEAGYHFHASSLRVELPRLELLMGHVENLIIERHRLDEKVAGLPIEYRREFSEVTSQIERGLKRLTQSLVDIRLVPLAELFSRMQLIVKDVSRESQKEIRLRVNGEQTRIDKVLVDQLIDPLVHLVRNAVVHGLENSEERKQAGKAPVGELHLWARSDGSQVVITIEDDGRGIDLREILGEVPEEGTDAMQCLLDKLSEPGYSTQSEADRNAGRGLGMDIVQKTVQQMAGHVRLRTELGRGTTFHLYLPVTVALLDALLVKSGGQIWAIPLADIDEVVEVSPLQVHHHQELEVLTHRGYTLPFHALSGLMRERQSFSQPFALIHRGTRGAVAIGVDGLAGQQQLVVRSLVDPLVITPWCSGAGELGDGRLALVIQIGRLLENAA